MTETNRQYTLHQSMSIWTRYNAEHEQRSSLRQDCQDWAMWRLSDSLIAPLLSYSSGHDWKMSPVPRTMPIVVKSDELCTGNGRFEACRRSSNGGKAYRARRYRTLSVNIEVYYRRRRPIAMIKEMVDPRKKVVWN